MGFPSKLLVGAMTAVAFYTGVYVDQKYELPTVKPAKLLDDMKIKINIFINKRLEEYKNDKPKVRQQCTMV